MSDKRAPRSVSWTRSIFVVLLLGVGGVFAEAAWDGEWPPQISAMGWLILVSGLLVIAVVSTLAEAVHLAKQRDAEGKSS